MNDGNDVGRARSYPQWVLLIGLLLVINLVPTYFGGWQSYWWLVLFLNFVLLVILAERIESYLDIRSQNTYQKVLAFGCPILLVVTWELVVRAELLNPQWFPPPSKIVDALWDLAVNYDQFNKTSLIGRPWLIPSRFNSQGWPGVQALINESHLWATLSRVLVGFVIGTVPGIVLGMIMGLNRTVRMMLDATLSAIYVLPKIAIFPLMMLIFADPFGEGPKIAVVAISAFFLVTISTMAGVRDIDDIYIQAGKNFGANRLQMLHHIIFPAALPIIFSGLRLALGTALIVIIAIEFVRAQNGVGYVVFYYWQILVPEKMYAGLVVVMVLGIVLTLGLQWLEKRIMPWR